MGIFDSLFGKQESFDFDTVDGISSIPIPKYKRIQGMESPEKNIEYILQRKATEHKKNGRMDLAIACLRKSNEIFPHSNFMWAEKDYLRLVEYLKQDGQFDEALKQEKLIRRKFSPKKKYFPRLVMGMSTSDFKKIYGDSDLVEATYTTCVCGECAKYRGRVFSVEGKNKRFPLLPDYLKYDPPEHKYCSIDFHPFLAGVSKLAYLKGDPVKASNKPFVDDRTEQEMRNYYERVYEGEQEIIDREEYDLLREFLADVCPKTFGAFRKMKNTQSSNFIKIENLAFAKGIKINKKYVFDQSL